MTLAIAVYGDSTAYGLTYNGRVGGWQAVFSRIVETLKERAA